MCQYTRVRRQKMTVEICTATWSKRVLYTNKIEGKLHIKRIWILSSFPCMSVWGNLPNHKATDLLPTGHSPSTAPWISFFILLAATKNAALDLNNECAMFLTTRALDWCHRNTTWSPEKISTIPSIGYWFYHIQFVLRFYYYATWNRDSHHSCWRACCILELDRIFRRGRFLD